MIITDLKIDYQKNPLGIANKKPIFSWKYNSEKKETQKSYKITVSSKENGQGDIWDSGTVISEQTVGIEYEGSELTSRQLCYVTVTVMTNDGDTANAFGTFEMGLLDEKDWKGKWVGTNANFQGNALLIRKEFCLGGKNIKRGRVYLIAVGYHELSINGIKADDRVLAPSQTDYTKRICYVTYDITDKLTKTDNTIGIEIGHGWLGKRSAICQIYIEYEDGTFYEDQTQLDGKWWQSSGAIVSDSIYGGEKCDGVLAEKLKGWNTNGYDTNWGNGWLFTFLALAEKAEKNPDLIEKIKVCDSFKPLTETKLNKGITVYNFGQNLSGWCRIKVKGEKNSRIIMKFAEGLKEDGNINQLNLRSAENCDIYILNGNGIEEYAPKFTYHGFQYMQAEITGNAEILEIVAEHVHNDVKQIGNFECSDKIINSLHKSAQMTELNNLHSIMTDCPQRDERLGWLNDLSSRIFQTINNFDVSVMLPKLVKDFADTQDESGAIADTAPFIGGTRPADPVCSSFLLFAYKAYQYYGDTKIVRDNYRAMKGWVDFLLTRQKGYIMDYSYYGDWVVPEIYNDQRPDGIFMSSAYLYWQLDLFAKLAKITGNTADYENYSAMEKESGKAFNEKYYDSNLKKYENGGQAANSVALSLNLAPECDRKAIAENIKKDIIAKNYHSTCGNQGYRHLFYAMGDEGFSEIMVNVLTNSEYPGWGYMAANGATTIWERWEKEMQLEMHSFDHPMFGSFDGFLYEYLGGIRVDNDSFAADKITVRPEFVGNLDFVNSSIQTIRGLIVSDWKRINGAVEYSLEIPQTTEATVILKGEVKLNGKIMPEKFCLTAGKYCFIIN